MFPNTNLTAKGFLGIFASGKNPAAPGAPLHTDFTLEAGGAYLALLKPDGTAATEFAPTFPAQFPDISYGISQDVATDGNMDAWTRLSRAATNGLVNNADFFKVQGLNVDGTPNPAYENLLDAANLIDYILVIFFGGNLVAPISLFLSNANPNNLFCVRNRTGLHGGFRFFAYDSEHTLLHESPFGSDEIHRNRTGPFPAGDPLQQGAAAALLRSNPQYIFTRLTANAEFRLRVADHVQKQRRLERGDGRNVPHHSELHRPAYHRNHVSPPNTTNDDGDAFEFVELKIVEGTDLELNGVSFTNGISYSFPVGTFAAPGQFIVLASNPTAFTNKYPGVRVDGVYTNNLSNGGEAVTLVHVTGAPAVSTVPVLARRKTE